MVSRLRRCSILMSIWKAEKDPGRISVEPYLPHPKAPKFFGAFLCMVRTASSEFKSIE